MTAARDLSAAGRRRTIERVAELVAKLSREGDFVGAQIATEVLHRLMKEGADADAVVKGAPVIDLNSRREQRRG